MDDDPEVVVDAMSSIITAVGNIVTGGITWLGDTVEAVTASGNELLLFFVLVGFMGAGIGLMRRIIG